MHPSSVSSWACAFGNNSNNPFNPPVHCPKRQRMQKHHALSGLQLLDITRREAQSH
ncbi:MAG: hypothetical protein LBI89_03095 [Prevotellaceae bacterium]|nr:hypothetical protein [Prevotellaceae bacterium]